MYIINKKIITTSFFRHWALLGKKLVVYFCIYIKERTYTMSYMDILLRLIHFFAALIGCKYIIHQHSIEIVYIWIILFLNIRVICRHMKKSLCNNQSGIGQFGGSRPTRTALKVWLQSACTSISSLGWTRHSIRHWIDFRNEKAHS